MLHTGNLLFNMSPKWEKWRQMQIIHMCTTTFSWFFCGTLWHVSKGKVHCIKSCNNKSDSCSKLEMQLSLHLAQTPCPGPLSYHVNMVLMLLFPIDSSSILPCCTSTPVSVFTLLTFWGEIFFFRHPFLPCQKVNFHVIHHHNSGLKAGLYHYYVNSGV